MKFFRVSLYIVLLFVTSGFASNFSLDSLEVYEMGDSIVVVANRFESSIKNVAFNYQIIERKRVERLATHSALQLVDVEFPSSFIMEKKVMGYGVGPAGSGQIFMRGIGGQPNTGVLVLINGHPDFMGIFGHPLPDVYGIDDIQQVEILSGAASTVFGSNAMGGVINLVTKPDYDRLLRLSLEGGSFNTYNMGLNTSKRFGDQGLSFSIRHKRSDGHLDQTSFQSIHLQGSWDYRIHPNWNLSLSGRYVPYKFDDPSRGNRDPAGLGTFGKIERGTGELKIENKYENWKGSSQIYTNFGKHQFYDGFKSNDFAYGLSTYQYWKTSNKMGIASGVDALYYGGQAENNLTRLPNGNPVIKQDLQQYSSLGLYAMGFYKPIEWIQLKAGIRYQTHSLGIDHLSPLLSLVAHPWDRIKFFAGYKNGFRIPTMRELYLFPSANDQLQEENVNSIEAGAAYHWDSRNALQVTLYQNNIDNLIQLQSNPVPPPLELFINSGQALQTGAEFQVVYFPNPATGVRLTYAYLEPDDLTAFNPKSQLKFSINQEINQFSFNIYGKYVQNIYAANGHQSPLPDYFVMNLSASYLINPVTIKLKLFNLLDKKYYYLPGYEAPPLYALAGFSFNL